ncbi:MAG: flippase-like domain-containing protein [Colwellia sp.]|nr:flippase-like domain-containing protein [Colwellia sp.]
MKFKKKHLLSSLIISAAIVYFATYKIDYKEVTSKLAGVNSKWIVSAFIVQIITTILWSMRWKMILETFKQITFVNLLSASLIGMLGNNFLPAKMGELVRAYILSRREGLYKTKILSSVFVEKVVESLTLLIVIACVYPFLIPLLHIGGNTDSHDNMLGISIFIALNLAIIAAIILLFRYRHRRPDTLVKLFFLLPAGWLEKIRSRTNMFYDGIDIFKHKKKMVFIAAISLIYWFFVGLRTYFTVNAFNISMPFIGSFLISFCILLSISISTIPGHIGVHHAGSTLGLMLLDVDINTAVSVAVLLHGIPFISTTVGGLLFLWREHIKPFELAAAVEEL